MKRARARAAKWASWSFPSGRIRAASPLSWSVSRSVSECRVPAFEGRISAPTPRSHRSFLSEAQEEVPQVVELQQPSVGLPTPSSIGKHRHGDPRRGGRIGNRGSRPLGDRRERLLRPHSVLDLAEALARPRRTSMGTYDDHTSHSVAAAPRRLHVARGLRLQHSPAWRTVQPKRGADADGKEYQPVVEDQHCARSRNHRCISDARSDGSNELDGSPILLAKEDKKSDNARWDNEAHDNSEPRWKATEQGRRIEEENSGLNDRPRHRPHDEDPRPPTKGPLEGGNRIVDVHAGERMPP